MLKTLITVTLSLALTGISALPSIAETTRLIQLQDGSTLKGTVIGLSDGVYTIKTAQLGTVTINESDVLAITQPGTQNSSSANPTPSPSALLGAMNSEQFQNQVMSVQNQIMADPQKMAEIQQLMQDPEIMRLMSDPQFLNDVMTYDMETITNNPNVQRLMENPKIRQLLETMQQGQR
jgi:hypothetical protein